MAVTPRYQCVDLGGSDAADGFTWLTAKQTIAAALAALPDGGGVFLGPTGPAVADGHVVTSTLNLRGHFIKGMAPARQVPFSAPATINYGQCCIRHDFSGPLFEVYTGKLENLFLYNPSALNTGAAISSQYASGNIRGWVWVDDVVISSAAGWERCIDVLGFDGAPQNGGFRDVFFNNLVCFGATTGENIKLDNAQHVYFNHVIVDPAPLGVGQKVLIRHGESEDVHFTDMLISGDFDSSGGAVATSALTYKGGSVIGNILLNAGSNWHSLAPGRITGSYTNNGGANNAQKRLGT